MSFGMNFKEFEKRIDLLSIAKSQVKKLAKDLKAKEVKTNSSTSLNTTFYILLKKGKSSMYDVEICIEIRFDSCIIVYGQNIDINLYRKPTKSNILKIYSDVKKALRSVKK